MECNVEEENSKLHENPEVKDSGSSENFQKFIYELFEKNGILNDLRAYLRGHIVNVLKTAETGDLPACQKNFTQRLELSYQALNILIAEYLLRLDFNYSLSVFVSEIPLANMVFNFSKSLLSTKDASVSGLGLDEGDIWSVLNYLGVKCDSEHACKIVEMYKSQEKTPLLYCIFKCLHMYHKDPIYLRNDNISDESISSLSGKSSETLQEKAKSSHKTSHHRCQHYAFCKSCQSRVSKIKEKYKKKKMKIAQKAKSCAANSLNVDLFMRNINVVEQNLIDEMFQQLKTVYEAEVEMVKEEEEKIIKRSLAAHAAQLQRRREQLEESYKAREEDLLKSIEQKKRFLWGLAKALREQHQHMSEALKDVRSETQRLADKESILKTQLQEAEETIKKRGEDMRNQISQELLILEGHLDSIKKERDAINMEKSQLENLKNISDTSKIIEVHESEKDDLRTHYDSLKDEIAVLKKYIESTKSEPKCVTERGTVTELGDGMKNLMNNENVGNVKDGDDKIKANQVVNDLKKQKNVNFSQSNLDEIYRELSRERSRSTTSSEAGDAHAAHATHDSHGCGCNHRLLLQMKEENDRLKEFARQQSEHIHALSSERERLQAHMIRPRPRTAPSAITAITGMNPTSSATFSSRVGAGEELLAAPNVHARARVLLPGDAVPFVGVIGDRADKRQQLINQWRALRQRGAAGVAPGTAVRDRSPVRQPDPSEPSISASPLRNPDECERNTNISDEHRTGGTSQCTKTVPPLEFSKPREKSPKSLLIEAKEKLRNSNNTREAPRTSRDKSPNAVLREAKLRLRKLEIEAEAVEKSYIHFRKRQDELKFERDGLRTAEDEIVKSARRLDIPFSKSAAKCDTKYEVNNTSYKESPELMRKDFEKYLLEYQTITVGQTLFKNKNSNVERAKPIPGSYTKISEMNKENVKNVNYLETPLTEFRKLYQTNKSIRNKVDKTAPKSSNLSDSEKFESESNKSEGKRREIIKKIKKGKQNELEILKNNINKIYPKSPSPIELGATELVQEALHSPEKPNSVTEIVNETSYEEPQKNLLMVEVENVCETSSVVTESHQDLLIVVESSVDTGGLAPSDNEMEGPQLSHQMTIIVSPKTNSIQGPRGFESNLEIKPRSPSPKLEKLTDNDVLNPIFHADTNKEVSSVDMNLKLSHEHEDTISEVDKNIPEDYVDDFSADVDNYNSRSDYENNSPISLPKTSEDENFWDS